MLKYVALLKVDRPHLCSHLHESNTARYFKSSIEFDKTIVEQWLKDELIKYPNASVNDGNTDKEYLIYTSIIAFDELESKNVELFLDNLHLWW